MTVTPKEAATVMAWFEVQPGEGERWTLLVHNADVEPERIEGEGPEALADEIAVLLTNEVEVVSAGVMALVANRWGRPWSVGERDLWAMLGIRRRRRTKAGAR